MALCLAGLVALVLSAFFVTDYALTSRDLIISLYLGVFQVGMGFTLVVLGSRHVPAAQVGLLALVEPIFSTPMGLDGSRRITWSGDYHWWFYNILGDSNRRHSEH